MASSADYGQYGSSAHQERRQWVGFTHCDRLHGGKPQDGRWPIGRPRCVGRVGFGWAPSGSAGAFTGGGGSETQRFAACSWATENAREAALVEGIEVHAFETLRSLFLWLEGKGESQSFAFLPELSSQTSKDCFSEIRGQELAKRAATIGGRCSSFVVGCPPGCGKTMVARRLPGIMPPMTPAGMS